MKKQTRRKALVCTAIFSLLLCICVQCVWFYTLEGVGARFVSPTSEENTLIRIQRLSRLTGDIDTVFMGSSMTERLLSRGHCATVAVSHSPYMTGLRLMKGTISFPKDTVYVLEATNMMHASRNEISARMSQTDFTLFRTNPVLSIAAKPTNLLVSSLFYMQGMKKSVDDTPFETVTEPLCLDDVADLTPEEVERYKEYIEGIEELRSMGGQCVFLCYPRVIKSVRFAKAEEIARRIAKHMGMPVLDYNTPYWNGKMHFSDGFHMVSRDPLTIRFMNTVARDAHAACAQKQ